MKINEIESNIAQNKMTAAQVFTQMRQHCTDISELKSLIAQCREQKWDNKSYPILIELKMTHEQSLIWDKHAL